MSWLDPPGTCPEIVKSMSFGFGNPLILVEIVVMIPILVGLQTLLGWDNDTMFGVAVVAHAIALPIILIASAWYAYDYIPRKWKEDYDKCKKGGLNIRHADGPARMEN